jgi:hypothetical protein
LTKNIPYTIIRKTPTEVNVALDSDDVKSVLGMNIDKLRVCMQEAWDDYQRLPDEAKVRISPRSRASVVYDFIVEKAKKLFIGAEGVYLSERRGFLLINFYDRILLRFKKFNRKLMPHGIRTGQNSLFMNRQGVLLECPEATKLIAGYQLNDFQNGIELMAVVCPNGKSCELYFALEQPKTTEIVPLRDYEVPDTATRRVHAKEGIGYDETRDKNI